MIFRRREGEYFRYGINWQYDKQDWGYWIALYLVLPYWITQFTSADDIYSHHKVTASFIKQFRLGLGISTGRKFHWLSSIYQRTWRELWTENIYGHSGFYTNS